MEKVIVPEEMLEVICEQAREEYPNECCGMILGSRGEAISLSRVRKCLNAQDVYHQRAPDDFPRTARTAYFIDPRELLMIEREIRERHESIRVIYHSHVDVDAYFSEEDVRMAVSEGEPIYPGVAYLVLSVKEGRVVQQKLFWWDEEARGFQE